MEKYKLINKTSGLETICSKVTLNGFDYYTTDELLSGLKGYIIHNEKLYKCTIINNLECIVYEKDLYAGSFDKRNCLLVIATNNFNNIDIPKVINIVNELATDYAKTAEDLDIPYCNGLLYGYIDGYNQSQLNHPNTDEDMIEFGKFCHNDAHSVNKIKTFEELLEIWKSNKIKILYYV